MALRQHDRALTGTAGGALLAGLICGLLACDGVLSGAEETSVDPYSRDASCKQHPERCTDRGAIASDAGTLVPDRQINRVLDAAQPKVDLLTGPDRGVDPDQGAPVDPDQGGGEVDPTFGTALPPRMPESSGGQVLVVDPLKGDDASGKGTDAQPYQTIKKAISVVTLSGGIIEVVGDGVTLESGSGSYVIDWARAGNPDNPVTIRTRTPLGITISGTGAGGGETVGAWIHQGGTGLRIRGFRFSVTGIMSTGVQVDVGTRAIEVDRSELTGNGGMGVIWKGGKVGTSAETRNIQLWNSTFHDNGDDCDTVYSSGYFCLKGTHNVYLGQVSGGAAQTDDAGVRGGVVANNVFYGSMPGSHAEFGPQAHDVYVVNNTFYGNAGLPKKGLSTVPLQGDAVIIFDNPTSYPNSGMVVKNNLMVANRGHAVRGSGDVNETSNLVERNLAHDNQNLTGGSTSEDYEAHYGSYTHFTVGPAGNLPNQDPFFIDPAGHDFHLKTGSPAIASGDEAFSPPTDLEGHPRKSADLGAFAAP